MYVSIYLFIYYLFILHPQQINTFEYNTLIYMMSVCKRNELYVYVRMLS